jgi:hypothetical protein
MEIIKQLYTADDIIYAIMKIGIETASTRKAFFNDYAGGK